MKKAFTLIELIIVVIIVGILATLAIPQYINAVERSKFAKAKHVLKLFAEAELIYNGDTGGWWWNITAPNIEAGIGTASGMGLKELDTDPDWLYSAWPHNVTGCRVIAGRKSGVYAGCALGLVIGTGEWFYSNDGTRASPKCPSSRP